MDSGHEFAKPSYSHSNMDLYKQAIGQCCNPDCIKTTKLDTHHIVPLKQHGVDEFVNYIVLCETCHLQGGNYHTYSTSDSNYELLVWKFYRERLDIGYTSDDYTEEDYRAILQAAIKVGVRAKAKNIPPFWLNGIIVVKDEIKAGSVVQYF